MRKRNKLEEIYQMAEFLLRKGARCSGYTSRMEHPVYLAACNYPAKFMDLIFKYYPDLQYDQWVLLKNAIKNNAPQPIHMINAIKPVALRTSFEARNTLSNTVKATTKCSN